MAEETGWSGGLDIKLQQAADGAITNDNIQSGDEFSAAEFLDSKKTAIQTMKQQLQPKSEALKKAQKAKAEAEKWLAIEWLDATKKAEYETAKKDAETAIAGLTKEMKWSLDSLFVDAPFFLNKQAIQTGEQMLPGEVVYFKTQVIDSETNTTVDKYILVGTKELFEGTFVQGILDGLDTELEIKTADIIDGFKGQYASLQAELWAPEQQWFFAKRLWVPAGMSVGGYLGDKLFGVWWGDESKKAESEGFWSGLMTKTTKFIDGIAGTGEKLAGKNPEATWAMKKMKWATAWLIGTFAWILWIKNAELDAWIAANGGLNMFGGRNGLKEKPDAPVNNSFCDGSPDYDKLYDDYCAQYASLDIPTQYPDQATRAALKNNNPGNIKMPSKDGPLWSALAAKWIIYSEGTEATDGWKFIKFENVGDGLFAMYVLLSTQYKDYTLWYGLDQYANGSYKLDDILKQLPTPPAVTGETAYKELTDDQFEALIHAQMKTEDDKLYALMQSAWWWEATPVALDEEPGSAWWTAVSVPAEETMET